MSRQTLREAQLHTALRDVAGEVSVALANAMACQPRGLGLVETIALNAARTCLARAEARALAELGRTPADPDEDPCPADQWPVMPVPAEADDAIDHALATIGEVS
jgi:hypothetical protein